MINSPSSFRFALSAGLALAASTLLSQALTVKTVPSFESASIYLEDASPDAYMVYYRAMSEDGWLLAPAVETTENNPTPRLSLLGLTEGTEYEFLIATPQGTLTTERFTTLSSQVPIARTIQLGDGPIVIDAQGSPDGWIRYVADAPIHNDGESYAAIHIKGAQYVILDGLRVVGGQWHAIHVDQSAHVRILNCEISDWGIRGERDYAREGKFYGPDHKLLNNQAAIFIDKSDSVLVERCYMHDPRGTSHSWALSHPAGPNAILMETNGNTIIRWNDFIGSDQHRWNDAIEGRYNGYPHGGFKQDADIYGNFIAYGNDDAMELDGGQMNVRVWGNWVEDTFAGISTAPAIYGPTYIYNNLIRYLEDSKGLSGDSIKNNYSRWGQGMIYLVGNTFLSGGGVSNFGTGSGPQSRLAILNNVFDLPGSIYSYSIMQSDFDFDCNVIWSRDATMQQWIKEQCEAVGIESNGVFAQPRFADAARGDFVLAPDSPGADIAFPVDGFPDQGPAAGIDGQMPLRPTGLELSTYLLTLSGDSPATVTATLPGSKAQSFQILKNEVFDWFTVETDHDKLGGGDIATLSVTLTRQPDKNGLRGAFLVKLANGFTRPVVVTAGKREQPALTAQTPGVVILAEAESFEGADQFKSVRREDLSGGQAAQLPQTPEKMLNESKVMTYTFDVPEAGTYYLAVRYFAEVPGGNHNSVYMKVGDDPDFVRMEFRGVDGWNWSGMSRDPKERGWFEPFKLPAGNFTLTISPREDLIIDTVALLSSPEAILGEDEPDTRNR
ncbi:MAG: right-handed parallel beta-helix repeat-containing protein [Verrucomicrobiota bacterium JB024]|nr:right-handed parallel beta-helix repeat-containing protein [Verrucomicrobiota bacterium JB024]